jgi:thioredoxin 1
MTPKARNIIIVGLLFAAIVLVSLAKTNRTDPVQQKPVVEIAPVVNAALPKLIDLGAGKCIPCKMMAPILEELKKEYQGRLDVVFIDVWENKNEASKYGIQMIPTQIFYDASGKELFRHEGFFAKNDILTKWKELGLDFAKAK